MATLGVAGGAYLVVREQIKWPTPQVIFSDGGSSGWLPLASEAGLIALPAKIGDATVQAVVDSGAQYSAVDTALAERLRLSAATPIPMVAFGVSGGPSLTRGVRLEADLGAFALKGLRAATLDLQPLSALTRQPFSLLLGRDFLSAVVMDADFPQRRIAFLPPDRWSPPPEAQAVAVQSRSGGLLVEVRVEQSAPVAVMLDTGATGALALSEDAARGAGLLDGRPIRQSQSVTLGGVSQDGMVRVRRIGFAGEAFDGVDVQIYTPAKHAPVPDGLLGLGILERFRLALDLPGQRIFLIGPKRAPRRRGPRPPTRFEAVAESGRETL